MSKDKKAKKNKSSVLKKSHPEHKIYDENIIEVKDVYKSFRVYYDKGSMLKEQFVNPGRSRYEEREILRGITFNVRRGETVALIGQNGCGKSTTLKMLTKILYPNKGTVTVNGKVSSLIELGAGFHPDMSGRENIYINASILGLKREDVDKRVDEIIRFSELEEFIDNPIRTYSSGMYMRLAFSVAINVDADILLIDEILAVGDQAFQEKCIRKLDEQRQKGVTVVLVSHSMGQVKEIADRCIWIENGRIVEDGDTESVCDHYEKAMTEHREQRDVIEDKQRKEEEDRLAEAAAIIGDVVEPSSEMADSAKEVNDKKSGRRTVRLRRRKEREDLRRLRQQDFSNRWQGGGSEGIPLLGTIGIMLVLLCHATQDIYGIDYEELSNLTIKMKCAGYVLFTAGRVGIPVLLMLTGFVLLSRDYTTRSKRLDYFKHVFTPIIVTWEIWILLYQLFLHIRIGRPLDSVTWVREALLIQYTDMSHAWFARMFMLMLLVVPYMANLLQWIKVGVFRMIMIMLWVLLFLFPGFDLYGQANGGEASLPKVPGTLCYLFYLCLGYMLSLYVQRIFRGSREVLLLMFALILTVVSQVIFEIKNVQYVIWYTFYGVSLMALCGFDIAVRLRLDRMRASLRKVLKVIYSSVIGIYLIHRPIQMFMCRYVFMSGRGWIGGARGMFAVRTVLMWVLSMTVSVVVVWMIGRFPVVGRYLVGEVE